MDQHCLAFLHGLFDENPKDHFEPQHRLLITAAMGGNDQMWFRRSGTGFQYASHILIEFEQAVSCKAGGKSIGTLSVQRKSQICWKDSPKKIGVLFGWQKKVVHS